MVNATPLETERRGIGWVLLFLSIMVAFGLALIDGKTLGFVRKATAFPYLPDETYLPSHSVFLENKDPEKRFLVLTGSCELSAIFPVRGKIDARNSIASRLQQKFIDEGLSRIEVVNLARAGYATTYNLMMFTRFLEDPRYKVFIWQNDFDTAEPWENQVKWDSYVFRVLAHLKHRFPQVHEIQELLNEAPASIRTDRPGPLMLLPLTISTETRPHEILASFLMSLRALKSANLKDEPPLPFKQNTLYLRQLVDRLHDYVLQHFPYAPQTSDVIDDKLTMERYRHPDTKLIHQLSPSEASRDNVLSLRVAATLAEIYRKKIYLYFGPEGRASNQENDVYTLKYKNPMVNAVRGFRSVQVIDLSNFPIQQDDLWGWLVPSYKGAPKITDALYEKVLPYAKNELR